MVRWVFGRGWDWKNPPNIPRVCGLAAALACRRPWGLAVFAAVVRGFTTGFGFSVGNATVVAGFASTGGIALVGAGSATETGLLISSGAGAEIGAGPALPTKSGAVGAAIATGVGSDVTVSLGTVSPFCGMSGSAEVTSDGSGPDE